jgi:hypothetical protein
MALNIFMRNIFKMAYEYYATLLLYTFAQLNRPFWDDLSVQRQRYHAHFKCAKV